MQIQVSAATPTPTPSPTPTVPAGLSLEGITWQLRNTISGSTITAFFQGGTVNGSGGCNTYNGSYTVTGETLLVGSLSTTGQLCSQEVMDQESQYLAALTAAQRYTIEGSELRITSLAGGEQIRLVYAAAATPR
jgi:heat shock protein HslJ